jgi:magnesium-transporting ATPase (P-type)
MKPADDDPIRAIVLTGDDVDQLTVDNWDTILTDYTEIVFSRTTPEQKMRIVEETKKRGDNVVAVVNSSFPPFYNLLTWFYCRLEMESTMHRQ